VPHPQLALLTDGDREYLHEQSLTVLETIGVAFESEKARDLLEKAGCRVDQHSQRVYFARDVVQWAISRLRRTVLLAARDRTRDVLLDGSRSVFAPVGVCPYVVDRRTALRREAATEDLREIGLLADALDEYGIMWCAVTPTADSRPGLLYLSSLACLVEATGKHIQGDLVAPYEVGPALEILHLAAPDLDMRARPIFSSLYCPVSPLLHEADTLECAMAMAREDIPIDIYSLPLSGATAPVTLAGAVIQNTCETLSAAVVLKLVNEDCRLIFTGNTGLMDMRTGAFAVATPEVQLMDLAHVELAHETYHVPTLTTGYGMDACEVGYRGGMEAAMSSVTTRLSGSDIVVGGGGVEQGQAVSLAKLVLDAEAYARDTRYLQGIAIDDDHAQLRMLAEVGPGGHFVDREETLAFMLAGEHWLPRLLRRTSHAERASGALDEIELANAKVDDLLATHQPMPLPDGATEAIARVLQRVRIPCAV
jgi:trimethylamine--corrinoid protein Co-methyltransferase